MKNVLKPRDLISIPDSVRTLFVYTLRMHLIIHNNMPSAGHNLISTQYRHNGDAVNSVSLQGLLCLM